MSLDSSLNQHCPRTIQGPRWGRQASQGPFLSLLRTPEADLQKQDSWCFPNQPGLRLSQSWGVLPSQGPVPVLGHTCPCPGSAPEQQLG